MKINFYFVKILCNRLGNYFYKKMRTCEYHSGKKEAIEIKQKEIEEKIESAEMLKIDSDFLNYIVKEKEKHISDLYSYIENIGVSFRNGNYDEVDKLLKILKL